MTRQTATVHLRIADLDVVRDRIHAVRDQVDALATENAQLRAQLDQARTPAPIDDTDREALADLIARTAGAIDDTTGTVDAVLGYLTDRGLLTADTAALRAELTRIREGADPTPATDGAVMTPAQAWAHLLTMPADQRLTTLDRITTAAADGHQCFALDHAGSIAHLTEQARRRTLEHQPDAPWVTSNDDGTYTVHWPDNTTAALITRDALTGLVSHLNQHRGWLTETLELLTALSPLDYPRITEIRQEARAAGLP